jgi:hypothetical protein
VAQSTNKLLTNNTAILNHHHHNNNNIITPRNTMNDNRHTNDMIGRVIDIVGITVGDRGRSCEEHIAYCGVVLAPDVLVRLVKEEIMVEGRIETVVSAYWVTDLVERCRVGFVPRYMVVKHADNLNGMLAQVSEVFTDHHPSAAIREKVYRNFGYCHATILHPDQNGN